MKRRADRRRIHWDILLLDLLFGALIVLTLVWAGNRGGAMTP